ncbi:MAG: hypothetical protein GY936_16155 [Ignavibacteriae bacterium]|nr:hypothetical protein [Ignavibacteriota bacterium]
MKIIRILVVLIFVITLVSCSQKEETKNVAEVVEQATEKVESELVRKGVVDVESIDHNYDGNVHECPMDWNVLSDEASSCPTCGMDLKEYTIADVKRNLKKYGYELKNKSL